MRFLTRFVFVFVFAAVAAPAAYAAWTKLPLPSGFSFDGALQPKGLEGDLFLSEENSVYLWEKNSGVFKELLRLPRDEGRLQLLSFENNPEYVFLLSPKKLLRLDVRAAYEPDHIFQSQNEDKALYAFFAFGNRWFLGRKDGLFESGDLGKTWARSRLFQSQEEVHAIVSDGINLWWATSRSVCFSKNMTLSKKCSPVLSESSDLDEQEDSPPPAIHFAQGAEKKSLWMSSQKNIYRWNSNVETWDYLSLSGLTEDSILDLAFSEKEDRLLAATPNAIFGYSSLSGNWHQEEVGSIGLRAESLTQTPSGVIAASANGVYFYGSPIEGGKPIRLFDPIKTDLFEKLMRLEPSIRAIQKEVVRYTNTSNGKIKRWQILSRLSALLPDVGYGKDISRSNNIDLDRGSTSEADVYIEGPGNIDKDWSFDISWDLGDFIFNSDQTSIDSRQKLMVDQRHDFLTEATRIYYERRRLLAELLFAPADDFLTHEKNLIRLHELTALLDAMTDGYFSEKLAVVYNQNDDLAQLWLFSAHGNSLGASV